MYTYHRKHVIEKLGDNNALRMKTVWKAIYLPEYQWYFYFLLALYKLFQRRIIIITDNTDGDTNGVIFFGFNVIVNEAQSLLRESLKQIYLHCYLTLRLLYFQLFVVLRYIIIVF